MVIGRRPCPKARRCQLTHEMQSITRCSPRMAEKYWKAWGVGWQRSETKRPRLVRDRLRLLCAPSAMLPPQRMQQVVTWVTWVGGVDGMAGMACILHAEEDGGAPDEGFAPPSDGPGEDGRGPEEGGGAGDEPAAGVAAREHDQRHYPVAVVAHKVGKLVHRYVCQGLPVSL